MRKAADIILDLLEERSPRSIHELQVRVPRSSSSIYKGLAELEYAGLITRRSQGGGATGGRPRVDIHLRTEEHT